MRVVPFVVMASLDLGRPTLGPTLFYRTADAKACARHSMRSCGQDATIYVQHVRKAGGTLLRQFFAA